MNSPSTAGHFRTVIIKPLRGRVSDRGDFRSDAALFPNYFGQTCSVYLFKTLCENALPLGQRIAHFKFSELCSLTAATDFNAVDCGDDDDNTKLTTREVKHV